MKTEGTEGKVFWSVKIGLESKKNGKKCWLKD